jgi:hypothetical protein
MLNTVVIAGHYLVGRPTGQIAHSVLMWNYPLSWLLWELDLLEPLTTSRWAFLSVYTILGSLVYGAIGAGLGRLGDLVVGRIENAKLIT